MAHNFRIIGDYYLSPAGNDTNPGTDPNYPKASLNGVFGAVTTTGKTVVIGAGMYEEAMSRTLPTGTTIIGDGTVKLRGSGSNSFVLFGTSQTWRNVVFENYASMNFSPASVIGCTFKDIPSLMSTTPGYQGCKFINVVTTSSSGLVANGCIFFNCYAYTAGVMNSYFNGPSTYRIKSGAAAAHDYNNVMCPVYINTTLYADLATQKAAANTYNVNSFNLDPQFNNSSKLDFTLKLGSPHLNASNDTLSNVGGTSYAVSSIFATSAEWKAANGAVFNNIVQSGQDAVIAAGQNSGYVISAPWKLFANPQEMEILYYIGQLLFNKTAPTPATNNNVPDANVFAGSNANGGGNPDRLTIEARWATSEEMPAQDSDWINGGYGAPGLFYKFEIGAEPRLYYSASENLYYGCGSASYQPGTSFSFPVMWLQFRVTLTNLYVN